MKQVFKVGILSLGTSLLLGCGAFSQRPGRFVAIPPPTAGSDTYGNFIWVLDTETGDIKGYRFAQWKDDAGVLQGWAVIKLR